MLVLAAWLSDRLGLTLRNVGLAAGAILLVNPVALFSAGFQLSFAATTALVVWFEGWRHRSRTAGIQGAPGRAPRLVPWAGDLVLASILASAATLPLTAQHFGTVTPWGVLANLADIPLTGLWIMPAGLGVLLTQFLPAPDWLGRAGPAGDATRDPEPCVCRRALRRSPPCAASRATTRRAGAGCGSFNGCDRILFGVSVCSVAEPLCRGGTRIGRRVPHP